MPVLTSAQKENTVVLFFLTMYRKIQLMSLKYLAHDVQQASKLFDNSFGF